MREEVFFLGRDKVFVPNPFFFSKKDIGEYEEEEEIYTRTIGHRQNDKDFYEKRGKSFPLRNNRDSIVFTGASKMDRTITQASMRDQPQSNMLKRKRHEIDPDETEEEEELELRIHTRPPKEGNVRPNNVDEFDEDPFGCDIPQITEEEVQVIGIQTRLIPPPRNNIIVPNRANASMEHMRSNGANPVSITPLRHPTETQRDPTPKRGRSATASAVTLHGDSSSKHNSGSTQHQKPAKIPKPNNDGSDPSSKGKPGRVPTNKHQVSNASSSGGKQPMKEPVIKVRLRGLSLSGPHSTEAKVMLCSTYQGSRMKTLISALTTSSEDITIMSTQDGIVMTCLDKMNSSQMTVKFFPHWFNYWQCDETMTAVVSSDALKHVLSSVEKFQIVTFIIVKRSASEHPSKVVIHMGNMETRQQCFKDIPTKNHHINMEQRGSGAAYEFYQHCPTVMTMSLSSLAHAINDLRLSKSVVVACDYNTFSITTFNTSDHPDSGTSTHILKPISVGPNPKFTPIEWENDQMLQMQPISDEEGNTLYIFFLLF